MSESSIELPASSIQHPASSIEQPASSFVSTNGIRLHVTRTGGDGCPLVALHGRTGNGRLWTRTACLLAPYFDIVMPDLRGHGLSDAPNGGYDHATMVGDILGVMDALNIERTVLMGGSMGAALATRIAAEQPHRVEKLVLHLACWTSDAQLGSRYLENKIARKRDQFRTWAATPLPELIEQVRLFSPGWSEEDIRLAAESWQQVHENAVLTFAHDLAEAEWRVLVRRVRCPILALMGHKEPGYTRARRFCETELHPFCTFAPLSGGHTAMYEDFETYAGHLRTFLEI